MAFPMVVRAFSGTLCRTNADENASQRSTMDFLLSIPAWAPPAIIAGVLFLAAIVIYLLGMAQGYTQDDYRRARANRRRKRRR